MGFYEIAKILTLQDYSIVPLNDIFLHWLTKAKGKFDQIFVGSFTKIVFNLDYNTY